MSEKEAYYFFISYSDEDMIESRNYHIHKSGNQMKIRQKMLIMELSTAAAFIITIGLFFVLLHNITMLKNIEIQSQKVLNALNQTNYNTSTLVNSRFNFTEMDFRWKKSIEAYSSILNELNENPNINLIGKKLTTDILHLTNRWENIKIESLNELTERMKDVSENNLKSKVGKFTFLYASKEADIQLLLNPEEIRLLEKFTNYEKIVERELISYTTIIRILIFNISVEIERRINFTLTLVAIILSFVIIAAMIAAFTYAGGLSRQIKLVESTAKQVTAGNFNVKLNIKGTDEFKTLSENFNSFTEMLWARLDAVRTIMKDMALISGEMDDVKTVEKEILSLAINNSDADAGAIFLYNEEEHLLNPAFVSGDFPPPYPISTELSQDTKKAYSFFNEKSITPGENIIGKVASTGEAIFVKQVDKSKELPSRWSNDPLHISSFMAIPLLVSNNVLGVFALAKTDPYNYFTDLSFTNMKTFGEYTALSIDNRYKYTELKEKFELSRELSIATDIQQGLRLKKMPRYKNLQISTFHNTAKGISGDYYDVFNISESQTAVIVCDVAGKGIPAALIMVMIRTILRVIAQSDRDAGTMLTMLNSNISGKVGNDQYATIGIMIIDNKTGHLTFSNAAHLPLHIYRKSIDKFENYKTEGLPVGVEKDTIYTQQTLQLKKGDIAAICTDGITEARNIHGSEFSTKTLLKEIKKYSDKNANEISEIIGEEMEIFMRGSYLYDDQSLLILKYKG
ncbi:MAG: SpoIIE family protein phosphatase [Spirochaetaceae bacterium]|jgi:sigma-B regulation protein RsbU (phosphoserine phosphatase)|nr:SpoIIE family protein phosphatase [Spirochaetaceae bacterium]